MDLNLRQQYNDLGYAIAPQLFTSAEMAQFSQLIDPIYDQWMQDNETAWITEKLINMHALTHPRYFESNPSDRARLFDHIASPKLMELLESTFGTGLYFHNTQLFFNPHSLEKRPYWHRDLQYSPIEDQVLAAEQHKMLCLHIRIPLVSEIGVELVPGTHQRWDTTLEREVRFEHNGRHSYEALPNAQLISLRVGDVLIFSAEMIHRGNYALNPTRKALDLCLGKPHPFMTQYLDPELLPTDADLQHIRNSSWYQASRTLAASR